MCPLIYFYTTGCENIACEDDCHNNGMCFDGICQCREGFMGKSCEIATCDDNCNNHGVCVAGRCECESGYEGNTCKTFRIDSDYGHVDKDGNVICKEGYTGPCKRIY